MAKTLQQIFTTGSDEINQNFIIESWHVSQSIDAFTGEEAYDIKISGSLILTGSLLLNETIESNGNNNVLTYNTVTGLVTYTSSTAVGTTIPTGSFLTTASVSQNTITFTKGDGNTFPITVNTGSGGGIPGGSDTQIQYNNGGTFGASSNFKYIYSSHSLQQGSNTVAIGQYSHAEGRLTTTVGAYSHTEGRDTTAVGLYSHAEGRDTTASGYYSHAEGYQTAANGFYSHAEGTNTTSLGTYSHAEGYLTTAKGQGSHAEGEGTITGGQYSHAQGRYNIENTIANSFIIGNGANNASRKNLVLAYDTNFQISGSLFVSGALQSSGSNVVLMYNTSSGLITYTASSAIGGGGGTQFTYEIGEYVAAQGGVIFHRWLDGTTEYYKVVAAEEPGGEENWSNLTSTLTNADSIWDGETNTTTIITNTSPSSGAVYTANNFTNTVGTAHSDWYLPSIQELNKINTNMLEISETFDTLSAIQMQKFDITSVADIYWSSTENNSTNTWGYDFTNGTYGTYSKSTNQYVRPVRQFSI